MEAGRLVPSRKHDIQDTAAINDGVVAKQAAGGDDARADSRNLYHAPNRLQRDDGADSETTSHWGRKNQTNQDQGENK